MPGKISPSLVIADMESDGYLSVAAGSEIMLHKLLVTCGEIGIFWLVIQECRGEAVTKI
jgi:hypothetical protein